jgi:hypothetical protein
MLDSLDTLIAFVLIMLVVSLLITIGVQMVAAALNLRGLNLAQGLKRTFAVIVPNSSQSSNADENAKSLVNFILKGRFLSDSFLPDKPWFSWWRHATAIRPREVFDAIHRIATNKEPAGQNLRTNARSILIALGVDPQTVDSANTTISDAQGDVKKLTEEKDKILAALPNDVRPQLESAVNIAVKAVADKLTAVGIATADKAVAIAGTIDSAYEKFEYWTCICQERAQQWITMHTRILTIIFAFVAALGLQLDTVEIFKLVSSNKAVRDKLVAQSAAVTSQADKAFHESKSVLQKAYDAWPSRSDQAVQAALGKASIKIDPNDTREKLTGRIKDALASVPGIDAHLKSLNETIDKTALDTLKDQAGDYAAIKTDFDNTGFNLFPSSDHGRWGNGTWISGSKGHGWGILFSAGLLSLGAPFWYNALKNLTSLRSAVAQNISKEKEQAQKQPDGSKPKPPPTVMPS